MTTPVRCLVAVLAAFAVTVPAADAATTITTGPTGPTNDATPTFAFTADGPATCRVDEDAAAPCTSPFTSRALEDGPHVVAIEAGGAVASASFTVDTRPPDVRFGAGEQLVTDTRTTVTFTTGEPGLTTVCQVDDRPAEVCVSPWTTPDLPNGPHIVHVEATDPAGNVGADAVGRAFRAPEPETTFTAGPEGPTAEREPAFGLRATSPKARFECKLDDAAWAACQSEHKPGRLADGDHVLLARSIDAGGNVDTTPAERRFRITDCRDTVTIGAVEIKAACLKPRPDGVLETTEAIRLNGISLSPLSDQAVEVDERNRRISLGKVQLRIGSMTLFQGDVSWTVPEGDRVTFARIDLSRFTSLDHPPADSEAALDLQGDDQANAAGLPLTGEARIDFVKGTTELSATVELPKVLTDAEGKGLTGSLKLTADNTHRGLRLDGAEVKAPLAYAGKLELRDLYVRFRGDRDGTSPAGCNAQEPGLRWEGGASAIVLPLPGQPQLTDVGVGWADGGLEYARAAWSPGDPGYSIGAGMRIKRIGVSLCTQPNLRLQGRIGFSAGPVVNGVPGLDVPDAAVTFTDGDPWSIAAEAATATIRRGSGKPVTLKDLSVRYRSTGAVDVGGRAQFELPVKGDLPFGGKLDAVVKVDAGAKGFYEADKWNLLADGKACFSGKISGGKVAGVDIGGAFDNACAGAKVVVSSVGVAICGELVVDGKKLGAIGVGYRWSGDVDLIDGSCDLGRFSATASAARAAAAAGRLAGGDGGARAVAALAAATPRQRPVRVTARVVGRGWRRAVRYAVTGPKDVRVRFVERGGGVGRTLRAAARPGSGRIAFRPTAAAAGTRRVQAIVARDGLPVDVVEVGTFVAPARTRLAQPRRVRPALRKGVLDVAWKPVPGARRYAVRVALPDGRRLAAAADDPRVRLTGLGAPSRATVRVIGLRADGTRGRATQATTPLKDQR